MCYARRQRSSWARIKLSDVCIQSYPKICLNLLSELSFCSFITFLSSLFSSKEFVEFRLCTFRSLFNFQGSFHQPPRLTPKQYITYVPACQPLFWGFFNFFSAYAKILLFFRWIFIISLYICSCQVFFRFFRFFDKW